MLTKKRYTLTNIIMWTRWETIVFFFYAVSITALYTFGDMTFLNLPWTPIALVGTALAFMIGFQNNSAYGRIWEARKIWGGIINISRTWGMKVKDMVTAERASDTVSDEAIKQEINTLVFRHIGWLTALRHAMRQKKPWETFHEESTNREWADIIYVPEKRVALGDDLMDYLSPDEHAYVMAKNNKPTAILYLQSTHLRTLKEKGLIWEFAFLDLESVLQDCFDLQGKSERIKNFPYPRQYATLGFLFVRIFIVLLPFGVIPEFAKIGLELQDTYPLLPHLFVWLAVPFSTIVSWVFHTMERIGRVGENPFEGSANDVPISTISRSIEIDLRQLLGEDEATIPKPFPACNHVQM